VSDCEQLRNLPVSDFARSNRAGMGSPGRMAPPPLRRCAGQARAQRRYLWAASGGWCAAPATGTYFSSDARAHPRVSTGGDAMTLQRCNTPIRRPIRPALAAASPFQASDHQGRSAPGRPLRVSRLGSRRGDLGYSNPMGVTAAGRRRAWTLRHRSTVSGSNNTSRHSVRTRSTQGYFQA
jgi:hypothetical protein